MSEITLEKRMEELRDVSLAQPWNVYLLIQGLLCIAEAIIELKKMIQEK